jgi:pyruvate/2-oxoglutarate dehydrogenase complex dihydrolipoamide acyltransferase (E2) component
LITARSAERLGTTEDIWGHHRAFDGAYAARFIGRVKHILEADDWTPTDG